MHKVPLNRSLKTPMAKNNQIKPESSSEDQIMEPVKLNSGKNIQSVTGTIADSDSGSESESNTETRNDKEKEIDGDWFEKSTLLRSILNLSNHLDEENVKRRWNKLPMKKKIKIANNWDTLENKKFEIASRNARLGYEIMSAITEATT